MSRADYGIDAPPVVRNLGIGGSAIFLIGIAAFVFISEPAWLNEKKEAKTKQEKRTGFMEPM